MASKKPTRKPQRAMLAQIALATTLPLPETVSFKADHGILYLHCGSMADGFAWVVHFGVEARKYELDGIGNLTHSDVVWDGWDLRVIASEPDPVPEKLPTGTETALCEIAGGAR
ncbi:hypothetical protein AB0M02_00230 [Actinoplanes sp. NPDC051861]|uniref:hypothetical protein n=1 Tax=Actinoplanes sp. NPDC051861 TaxID=3155170 RepID=UPI00343EF85C